MSKITLKKIINLTESMVENYIQDQYECDIELIKYLFDSEKREFALIAKRKDTDENIYETVPFSELNKESYIMPLDSGFETTHSDTTAHPDTWDDWDDIEKSKSLDDSKNVLDYIAERNSDIW